MNKTTKNIMISVTAGILVLIGVSIAYQGNKNNEPTVGYTTSSELSDDNMPGHGMDSHYEDEIYTAKPTGELPAEVVDALDEAIMDEYLAHATYDAVLNKLGSTRPFSRIIFAEERHISMLEYLYDKYDLPVPEDVLLGSVNVEDTRSENCQIGVEAEIANADLYRNELLPLVTDYPDITDTFTRLMDASQEKHLPAFEHCAN